jgi:plastocyanin
MIANSAQNSRRMIAGITGFATVVCLACSIGCGGSKESSEVKESEAAKPAGAVWKPTGNEGTVTGKISFSGAAPKFKPLGMDADSVCAAKHSKPVYPETVVANDNGTLRNVLVYVKSGLEGKTFAVPDQPVQLDQDGCMYKPHVVGVQAGQTFKVITSDNTTHNIHPMPKVNREWNLSQPPGADPIVRTFSRPEVSIPVKCNQHPWMRAYIHVLSHPFYSVSGSDGTFRLEGLPPGDYEIEAVQEEYGAVTQKVSVGPKETKSVDFAYKANQAYRAGSLTLQPALVLDCCGQK